MLNELVISRFIALATGGQDHHGDDRHHSAQDWAAYFRAVRRTSPFERRPRG